MMIGRRSLLGLFGAAGGAAATGASVSDLLHADKSVPDVPAPLGVEFSGDEWLDRLNAHGVRNGDVHDIEDLVEKCKERISHMEYGPGPQYTSKKSWSEAYKHSEWRKDVARLDAIALRARKDRAFTETVLKVFGKAVL